MEKPRKPRTRHLGELVPKCLGEALAAQGFADGEIVTRWTEIAGPELAHRSRPLKLAFPRGRKAEGEARRPAVLTVEIEGAFALDLQMQTPVLIERINRYFGWRCVGEIRPRQTGTRIARPKASVAPPDPAILERARNRASGFEDERLGDAIARLGAAVMSANASR